MAVDQNATGTGQNPEQTPPGGTAQGAGQDGAAETITIKRETYEQQLREKSNLEAARKRVEALEQELAQRESGTPTPAAADDEARELQAAWAQLAASNHPLDKLQVRALQRQAQKERELDYRLDMLEVPATDRSEVEKIARQHGLRPSVAHKLIEADRLKQKEREISDREQALMERERLRQQGVVATTATPAAAVAGDDKTMTGKDYAAKVNGLIRAGKADEARKLMLRRETGELNISE